MRGSVDKWVIHFSGDDYWNSNYAVRHHLCRALHTQYRILWVNPIGTRFPSVRKKGFALKIIRKLNSLLKLLRKVDEGFYVITPFTIPVFRSSKILLAANRTLLHLQLTWASIWLRIQHVSEFHTTPLFAYMAGKLKTKTVVYYYADQYSLYRELTEQSRRYTEDLERMLQEQAAVILCCSHKICEQVRTQTNTPVEYFPHQVDYPKFSGAITKSVRTNLPPELAGIPQPIIGYYGTLTDSNDWDVIRYCVSQRPEYSFVFIGRKDISNPDIDQCPNVHFLGQKPYEKIQEYGAGFDVAIMFWVRREWIKHSSPLKLKEYLAMGKPVVSTLIEEVEREYKDIVYCTETKEEFLQALDKAVKENNSERIRKGTEYVRNDKWENILPYFA